MKKQQTLFYSSMDTNKTENQLASFSSSSSSPAPSAQPRTLTQWLQLQAGYSGIVDKYFDTQVRACLGSTCRASRHSQKYPETQCQDFLERLKERVELDRELLTTAVSADLAKKKEQLDQMLQSLFKRKINWVRYLAQLPVPVRYSDYIVQTSSFPMWLIDMMASVSPAFMRVKIQRFSDRGHGFVSNQAVQSASLGDLVREGNLDAIDRRINRLRSGQGGSEENPAGACPINELLVAQGDLNAIDRKILGLAQGQFGYEKNPAAARAFNEGLVEKGDPGAINRKIFGLARGYDGYEQDPRAARAFTEACVEKGDPNAIVKKIEGLATGRWYGYEADPAAARAINEGLVAKGDSAAIYRKLEGLGDGQWGYEKNPAAARAINDGLVAKGDPDAIDRKIEGLIFGCYGYKENPAAACAINDEGVAKGEAVAIDRKIEGLGDGQWGYEKNPAAARAFIEAYLERGDTVAMQYFLSGGCGYTRNLGEGRQLSLQILMKRGDPIAKVFLELGRDAPTSATTSASSSSGNSETVLNKKRRRD